MHDDTTTDTPPAPRDGRDAAAPDADPAPAKAPRRKAATAKKAANKAPAKAAAKPAKKAARKKTARKATVSEPAEPPERADPEAAEAGGDAPGAETATVAAAGRTRGRRGRAAVTPAPARDKPAFDATEPGETDEATDEADGFDGRAPVGDDADADGGGESSGASVAAALDERESVGEPPRAEPSDRKGSKKRPARRSDFAEAGEPIETGGGLSDSEARRVTVELVVNYEPGESCRIAFVEDARLEEFFSEPTDRVSRVGNIYVGRVTNVESQIQAAFVDFGLPEAGFLHSSDLHPRYFPGGEGDSERVGRKTPRRERPPIQECLRRGQEIAVQVLKEGVGTKGPSLTSYLSVPGRYLVMMPEMDKVGVSRKLEDEDQRRRMRKILDELDLPDGFGFILRTAGFDRTKEELQRDLDYLLRLWKDMERRRKSGGGPRLLYAESDLLLRTLRDQLTPGVTRIVIDNEHALRRAAAYLKIVSPNSTAKLEHYRGGQPVFHAFGIEQQLDGMHSSEVPLPSGGRLIIEQTEALVAIDVNSGKSRAARDAETNALQTNLEAVDEICRQLRLRDLGGLVINDLIDMRLASNRRKVEQRFAERLRRDRAKSTILPISAFGILEMTRQRMRGSYEQQHFQECPSCHGRGLVARPDSVVARAMRELALMLEHERVHRVELVVGPRVAGALLSTRRASLGRIERAAGKTVDVRISDAMPATRYSFYAYDPSGADIDIPRLRLGSGKPETVTWREISGEADVPEEAFMVDPAEEAERAREEQDELADAADDAMQARLVGDAPLPGEETEPGKKKRRRRRRRRRRDGDGDNAPPPGTPDDRAEDHEDDRDRESDREAQRDRGPAPAHAPVHLVADTDDDDRDDDGDDDDTPHGDQQRADGEPGEGGRKKRRRRRRKRRGGEGAEREHADAPRQPDNGRPREPAPPPQRPAVATAESQAEPKPEKKKRRGLYAAGRRALSASEKARLGSE